MCCNQSRRRTEECFTERELQVPPPPTIASPDIEINAQMSKILKILVFLSLSNWMPCLGVLSRKLSRSAGLYAVFPWVAAMVTMEVVYCTVQSVLYCCVVYFACGEKPSSFRLHKAGFLGPHQSAVHMARSRIFMHGASDGRSTGQPQIPHQQVKASRAVLQVFLRVDNDCLAFVDDWSGGLVGFATPGFAFRYYRSANLSYCVAGFARDPAKFFWFLLFLWCPSSPSPPPPFSSPQ